MTEPSTPLPPDVDASRAPAAPDPARSPHDRELPVNAAEGDRPVHAPPSSAAAAADGDANPAGDEGALSEDQVKLALRRVKDPELNLNILDLGLVYGIRVEGSVVAIDMTLTSPGCPSGAEIMADADRHLRALPGVSDVSVNLVWSPFWSPDRIEPRVRAYLGF
jgi:metal-sulfur cluster biosynthetic enzyme